jgi:D-cysteine desulfhydrase family pyridoxal phosphate-dependent enzyme
MSIGAQPRVRLATLPTPLQEAPRLRAALGGPERAPRILIKRDDLTGLALGGNKARKRAFLAADALRQGATTLVTVGAAQSNHARITAAAANAVGLRAVLVLRAKTRPPALQGNLLLDRILGAEVRLVPPPDEGVMPGDADEAAAVEETLALLRARGERPYFIPAGGSSAVGALGYVSATLELLAQLWEQGESPSRLYYAAGSRGTQSGLELGAKLYGVPYRLCGIAVSPGEEAKIERAARSANDAAALLGSSVRIEPEELRTPQEYIGPAYAVPTEGCLEAIRLLAASEGILLDPVYSAKAMAGMIDHIRRGEIPASETVVFLHTGGSPALFAQADELGVGLDEPAVATR